jgi:hypothetical protein
VGFSNIARRIAVRYGPALSPLPGTLLRRPAFIVGFNKSAKSMLVEGLARQPGLAIFPGEGNDVLWFRGFYPRPRPDRAPLAPLWCEPARFVRAVVESRGDRFLEARSQLGLYQLLRAPRSVLLNDSGMLAALLPDVLPAFPEVRIVHMIRDGRVVSFKAALRTLERMRAIPDRYRGSDCPTDVEGIALAQARYWCWTLDRVQEVEGRVPDQVMQVRYEDWCLDPMRVLTDVMRFLGLKAAPRQPPWTDRVVNLNHRETAEIPRSLRDSIENVQAVHLERFGYGV